MADAPTWLRAVPLPAVWVVLPLTVGPALADALGDRSDGVRDVASAGAWAVWVVGLLAALVPRTVSLTAVRTIAPAVLVAALWSAVGGAEGADAAMAAASGALVTALALWPGTAERFVDGSSYGDERRFPLRPPGPLLLGPIELAWVLLVAGVVTGPLLIADGATAPGAVALVVGVPLAVVCARALHGLARRWLVLVPAGVVVHDLTTLRDPSLLLKRQVATVRAAPADTEATDLTAAALGLALEIDLREPVTVAPAGRFGLPGELVEVEAVLVAPTRPGAVLRAMAERRLPTG